MTDSNKQSRVLVNVLGIPLLLSAIYFGGIYFQCLIFIAIFMSTFELYSMCLKKDIEIQIISIFLFYIYLFLTHFLESISMNIEVFFFWVILILSLEIFRKKTKPIENIAVTIFVMIWIGLFMNCIVYIRNFDLQFALVMFVSVWVCDSAAFFFGSKFGKTKIFPNISPNKTWVGTISAVISVFILSILWSYGNYAYIYYIAFIQDAQQQYSHVNYVYPSIYDVFIGDFPTWIFLSLIFGGISQIGDFVESMIKRQLGVKDSGTTLRGHGGFLDRMDSLILVAPCYYIYLKFIMGING